MDPNVPRAAACSPVPPPMCMLSSSQLSPGHCPRTQLGVLSNSTAICDTSPRLYKWSVRLFCPDWGTNRGFIWLTRWVFSKMVVQLPKVHQTSVPYRCESFKWGQLPSAFLLSWFNKEKCFFPPAVNTKIPFPQAKILSRYLVPT